MIDDFFDIFPRIIRSGKKSIISIKGRYEQRDLATLGELEPVLVPNRGYVPMGEEKDSKKYFTVPSHFDPADKSRLLVEIPPMDEGELTLVINQLSENGTKHTSLFSIGLYVLDDDLYAKRPYRGDLHVHCSWSQCGKRTDDPRYVAVAGREHGLDFMALTDHIQQEPSMVAKDFVERLPTGFLLIPGEECHLLGEKRDSLFCRNGFIGGNHIVSIGASQGVIRYANEHFEEYWGKIHEKAEKLDHQLPEHIRIDMAGADWIIDKIHEFGGMAIFCHPFWRPGSARNLADPVREYIQKQSKFDAMEVIGLGNENSPVDYEGNALCIGFWHEASIAAGRSIPLVGNTDSHNADKLLGTQYSIVFSEKCTPDSLKNAIQQGDSVAVRDYNSDCTPFVAGKLRLSSYAYFLLREYFPLHDELCALEGKNLRSALRGECAVTEIPQGKNWQEKLFSRYFG